MWSTRIAESAGAVVAVPGGAFVSGRRVSEVAVVVRPEAVARIQVNTYAGVAPQREAVLGGRAAVSYRPPAVVVNRTVVTRAVPPAPRVDFAHEREAIQNNQGRPLDRAGYNQIRQASPPPQQLHYRQATPAAVTQQGTPPPIRSGSPAGTPPARTFDRPGTPAPQTTTQPPPARTFERSGTPAPQTTTQPPPARTFERSGTPAPQTTNSAAAPTNLRASGSRLLRRLRRLSTRSRLRSTIKRTRSASTRKRSHPRRTRTPRNRNDVGARTLLLRGVSTLSTRLRVLPLLPRSRSRFLRHH